MYRETRYRHTSSECQHCGRSPDTTGPPRTTSVSSEASTYCGKRRYSMVKFGYHLAVPAARKTQGQESSRSNSKSTEPHADYTPHVIALVGLPARGKTYIARKLSRYLNWIGINTKVFNLGEYRRKVAPTYNNADFFKASNETGNALREQVCMEALADVIHWLHHEDGEVAVFDATNTTRKRRRLLFERLVEENGFQLFFVESICDKEEIIDCNIKNVKVNSPDYSQCQEEEVLRDFKVRIKHYEEQYQTLDEKLEPNLSFLQIFNAGEKVLVHKHEGHIQSRIVYYLMNVHIAPRTIFLTRHGESEFNVRGYVGGDSNLTDRGDEYARQLYQFISYLKLPKLKVWTSWLKRAIQTSKYFPGVQERWKVLNEIDAGSCDSYSYAEIKEQFPEDFIARDVDKFTYRYPRGESYEDLVSRLEPVIMELEKQESVLIVAHQAVLRCLLGYYLETNEDDLPWLKVPLHTVIKLEPVAYGCKVQYMKFPVNCVNTHRKRPKKPGFLEERFAKEQLIAEIRSNSSCPSNIQTGDDLMKNLDFADNLDDDELSFKVIKS